jgi:hypothetical protein
MKNKKEEEIKILNKKMQVILMEEYYIGANSTMQHSSIDKNTHHKKWS